MNRKRWFVIILCLVGCGAPDAGGDLDALYAAHAVSLQITALGEENLTDVLWREPRRMQLRVWVDEAQGPSVGIGQSLQTAQSFLPLEFTGRSVSLNLVLQIPVDAVGRLLLFELTPVQEPDFSAAPEPMFRALSLLSADARADVGFEVQLSPASSLAQQALMAINHNGTASSPALWEGYRAFKNMFLHAYEIIEAGLVVKNPVSVGRYRLGMQIAAKSLVAATADLQRQLADGLYAIFERRSAGETQQAFLTSFKKLSDSLRPIEDEFFSLNESDALFEILSDVSPDLTKVSCDPLWAFVPAQINFVDTDPTDCIGGTILLAPAEVATGISHYRIYLGGESLSRARALFLGTIPQTRPPMLLNISSPVAVGPEITHVWAFASDGESESEQGRSAIIANYQKDEQPNSHISVE